MEENHLEKAFGHLVQHACNIRDDSSLHSEVRENLMRTTVETAARIAPYRFGWMTEGEARYDIYDTIMRENEYDLLITIS